MLRALSSISPMPYLVGKNTRKCRRIDFLVVFRAARRADHDLSQRTITCGEIVGGKETLAHEKTIHPELRRGRCEAPILTPFVLLMPAFDATIRCRAVSASRCRGGVSLA